jgi:hypothetical protein
MTEYSLSLRIIGLNYRKLAIWINVKLVTELS